MNDNKNHSGAGTAAAAGIAGAVVGAGVAVAATKIMSDEKMRNKVKDTLTHAKDQVLSAMDSTAKIADQKSKQVSDKIHRTLKDSPDKNMAMKS